MVVRLGTPLHFFARLDRDLGMSTAALGAS
jgi:hypothetical protein